MNFLSSDVPDPTDFSTSAPGLRSLDASLRCTICGDLFDAPVTLPCGHCFCSAVSVPFLLQSYIDKLSFFCLSLVYSTAISSEIRVPELPKGNHRVASKTQSCHGRDSIRLEYSKVRYISCNSLTHLANIHAPNRPFILKLLDGRDHLVDKGTPKKRKRSSELTTPTVEPMFRRVAGPSNLRTPSSTTKQSKSSSRKLKASSDSEDVVEIMVPSSDVDEDEISTHPTRLNPQGTFFFKLLYCFR